jgi:ankyrin repeat protein
LLKKRSHTFPNTDPAVFFGAIKARDIVTIQRELKNGTDLEITDEFGFTPLWRAVDIGEPKIIQLLLDHGANYEAKFLGHNSVLDWALDKGKENIVDMVLAKMDARS